jgi:CRISPR-associated protein Cmr5
MSTRSQKFAQAAYTRIEKRGKPQKEYVSFAKRFPSLLHTCGLAQAVAFAMAKREENYLNDMAAVLHAGDRPELSSAEILNEKARTATLAEYLRLSRDALEAAGWLKRYVEAYGEAD